MNIPMDLIRARAALAPLAFALAVVMLGITARGQEGLDGAAGLGRVAPRPSDEVPEGLSGSDWSSIREAYEASRHAAHPVECGYQAHNPGQQWLTRFDGRGFSTEPDAGGWTWGLQLQRYGFAGQERAVSEPTQVSAAGQRVAYDWDATLQEWYVNDPRGLEHGYTVHERPPQGGESPLTFTLAVRGELSSQVQADGRGVHFVNGDGAAVLTYAGLSVVDADGQVLAARLQPLAEGLLLTVDERAARYPLTIDPIAQQAYLKASNTGSGDLFGASVSVSGNTVVVGANNEASNATGVNGDQSNNLAPDSGAAYVFVHSGTSWSQQAYLKASNTGVGDDFGLSVSVSGDTVVVGAQGEASNATGVNGDQSNDSAFFAGAAYVFVRSGTSWSQQAYLKASNTGVVDRFGYSVSVSGDTVVVGAQQEASNATGVNGDQSNDSAFFAGAAYVFVRSGTSWSQQAYLKASNTEFNDNFGSSLAVSGDTVVVGAYGEDSRAVGVNGEQSDNNALCAGAAYVFVRSGTSWSQQAYLKASNTGVGDDFGLSVSVSGDTVVVGARNESSNATGVNGDQSNDSAFFAGAAYVFVRHGTSWSQQAYLKASNTNAFDAFGGSVAVSGDTVVVGAPIEDSNATGVNGDQSNNSATDSGAAYVFVRSGTSWSQQAYLKASNTGVQDLFDSVSVSGDTVVVGAGGEDSNATGVNGDQSNNSAINSGAAYVFAVTQWTDLGFGLAGTSGVPSLVGTGTLAPSSPITLTVDNGKPLGSATLVIGPTAINAPFKGGTFVPVPVVLIFGLPLDGNGDFQGSGTWYSGLPPGTPTYFQAWIQDAAGPWGYSATNGLLGTTP